MANTLLLNKPQVFNGLGTLTYSVVTTEALNVQVQVTFPDAIAINPNWNDNLAGAGANNNGLRYMGAGSAPGLGSGTGSSQTGSGFSEGDLGLTHGAVGQGFGSNNPYPQPPVYGSNLSPNSDIQSTLSIVVNKNGSPVYTSTAPAGIQSALQFRTSFLASNGDTITVVLSSAASVDNQLNGVTSTISVGQGL